MKRPLSDEQVAILRRILKGDHPSPGSTYLGWKKELKMNKKLMAFALVAEHDAISVKIKALRAQRRHVAKLARKLRGKK